MFYEYSTFKLLELESGSFQSSKYPKINNCKFGCMRFTLVRQTNLTQKGRQENPLHFCMHVLYKYMLYQ